MTPPRRNGDDVSPKRALVNVNVSTVSVIRSFSQWNPNASLSSSRMRTWRNACLMFPAIAIGWNLERIRTAQCWFWSGGPGLRHSCSECAPLLALAGAS